MSELTVQYLVLERRDPARNMARFYVLTIEPTLFGDTALVREWGRLGGRGRRRLDLFDGHVQAVEALESWLSRKTRRGYVQRHSPCLERAYEPTRDGWDGRKAKESILE
ncbi:putative DNA-binding WGR domain protein [Bradyrhizobium sp. LM6.10]